MELLASATLEQSHTDKGTLKELKKLKENMTNIEKVISVMEKLFREKYVIGSHLGVGRLHLFKFLALKLVFHIKSQARPILVLAVEVEIATIQRIY